MTCGFVERFCYCKVMRSVRGKESRKEFDLFSFISFAGPVPIVSFICIVDRIMRNFLVLKVRSELLNSKRQDPIISILLTHLMFSMPL